MQRHGSVSGHRISSSVKNDDRPEHDPKNDRSGTPRRTLCFSVSTSGSPFVGGGVDYQLTRRFAVRGEAEYLYTGFALRDNQLSATHNNARISTGLVFHF